ncbi:SHOCT domain-containing protein [Pseudoflavonifractor sp. 524-17]|nr:SHOCT domain-containing protein [Pseudoflavonifractor sp. 524-17]
MLMQDKINAIITAENESGQYQPTTSHQSASSHPSGRLGVANELKTFKELLDSGVITQEEFDEKKKQLLGL